jgi:lipopolysaccharide export system permease protein
MRKFLGTYLFAIMLIIVIVVIFDAVEKIDDFIEMKAPLSKIAFQYYLNFIPFFINQFSGLFTFIAVIFFTSKMAYQTEIVAILSGGVSFKRLMWPYFLSAAAITTLSLLLNLVVIPPANARRVDFEAKYLKKNRNIQYDRHIYRQLDPGVFVYIRDYKSDTDKAEYLVLERHENHTIVAELEAADVTFNPETKHWTAPRYITRTFGEGDSERMEKYETKLDTLINLDATELGRVEELIKTMNYTELNQFIKQQKVKGSDMIEVFEVERAQRFSYPISTFILTLIGVSLSSRKVRGGTGLHIGVGITLCFSYILFAKFAEEFAKGGVLPPVLSVWMPNIIFAVIAIYLYKKAPK